MVFSSWFPVPNSQSTAGTGIRELIYHFPVHRLTEQLLKTIRKQNSIRPGDRLSVAVSGGADSVALLCLLLELREELGIVLSIAHVNHKLRGEESDEDERFVAALATQHRIELHVCDAPLPGKGKDKDKARSGIEAAARELRYDFFRQLARQGRVTKIATAHTLDDQAETLLLRIFRGTGIRGLSGIHPQIVFEEQEQAFGDLVRPLLGLRRAALQEFLRERGQPWREDSSNQDTAFLRNRVRHRLLPLIAEEFGVAAIEHMSELAEIARAEEEHWDCRHPEIAAAIGDGRHGRDRHKDTRQAVSLQTGLLLSLPLAAQRRVVRGWLDAVAAGSNISFRLIEEILHLAQGQSGSKLELPGGRTLRREREQLVLELSSSAGRSKATDYEYALIMPGSVRVPELGVFIQAQVVDALNVPDNERERLLDLERVPNEVTIRNWRPADRYWPAHTAAAKKVKELLSDRHATGPKKNLWPVAEAQGCGIVWMSGFAVPANFQPLPQAAKAIWIQEIPDMM